ncbi:AAA family ATPase [bacterium]|nr:AAA family ATPase [bacterium]
MFLKRVEIDKFRNFQNAEIEFSENKFSKVYSIASINGGGKSTLLQFIYIMLSCFRDKKLHKYIINLLETENYPEDYQNRIARFVLIGKQEIDLEYMVLPAENDLFNCTILKELELLEGQHKKHQESLQHSANFLRFYKKLQQSDQVTEELRSLALAFTPKVVFPKSKDYDVYNRVKQSEKLKDFQAFAEYIKNRENYIVEDNSAEMEARKKELTQAMKKQKEQLKAEGFNYITTFADSKLLLLLKSNVDNDILDKISHLTYLNGPDTQIYLFMSKEDKQTLLNNTSTTHYFDYDKFGNEIYVANNYNDRIRKVKKDLKNYYTYDFVSKKIIIKACKKAFEMDNKEKLRTNKFGVHYDAFIKDLNTFFDDKRIVISDEMSDVKFYLTSEEKELNPEDLSHGELKRLSIFIWLKYLIEEDSLVLMDEIDIALHPKWLYHISKDLDKWANHNQIILATHSPQIVSSTYYKNIIKLENENSVVKVKKYIKPPLDRDINAIVRTIMDAPDFPLELLELHKKYRKLIEDGKSDTPEAQELKEEILEHESENSAFFQEMNFDLDLME